MEVNKIRIRTSHCTQCKNPCAVVETLGLSACHYAVIFYEIFKRLKRRSGREGIMRHLWVVEMVIAGKFEPTIGVKWTRRDGRLELYKMKSWYPDDHFRLIKYVPTTRI